MCHIKHLGLKTRGVFLYGVPGRGGGRSGESWLQHSTKFVSAGQGQVSIGRNGKELFQGGK